MNKELLKSLEAAEFLGCGVSTLWRWAASGQVPAPIKIGGISRWRKSELELTLASAVSKRDDNLSSAK